MDARPKMKNSCLIVTELRPIDLLIDYCIEAVVATMRDRNTAPRRIGKQRTARCHELIVEASEMIPAAQLQRGCKASGLFTVVSAELRLAYHKCRIAHPEVQPVLVALLIVTITRSAGSPLNTASSTATSREGSTFNRTPGVDSG